MGRVTGRDVDYLKPPKFKNYLTISEVCKKVKRGEVWIRYLERKGRIPKAARVQRGQVQVRLWSPAQVIEIERIIKNHKPGRPTNE